MANWGIGLGGFASGVEAGVGLGRQLRADRRDRQNRRALDAADTAGRAAFDADVAAGKAQPGDWERLYSSYVVPRKVDALVKQGDLAGAESWRKWADGEAARRGGKLFASGMLKGQAGDIKGAIGDFVEAGKIKGYGGDYDIGDVEEITLADGTKGYKLTLTDPDGKKLEQQFSTPEEVMTFGATYLNPEAAYAEWKARGAKAAEFEADIAKEKAKAKIGIETEVTKKALGLDGGKDALALRKQAFEELKGDPGFVNLSSTEQEAAIAKRMTEISGGGAGAADGPKRPVIVDQRTGRVISGAPEAAPSGATSPARKRPEVTAITNANGDPLPAEATRRPGVSSALEALNERRRLSGLPPLDRLPPNYGRSSAIGLGSVTTMPDTEEVNRRRAAVGLAPLPSYPK